MADLDLDAIRRDYQPPTRSRLVGGMSPDVDWRATVCETVLALVAEVERLRAEDERKGDTIAERVDQLDWVAAELRCLRAAVLSEVEFLASLGTEEDSSMVAGWPEATAAFDRLTRAASGMAERGLPR